ncbi:MAG TPA: tetratricopeptide repeat protein [Sphingomonadales bacterium]|nr:tetratricopeptide repeat protein [Sphingomonadales bacterium]
MAFPGTSFRILPCLIALCLAMHLSLPVMAAEKGEQGLRTFDEAGLLRMGQRLEAAGDYANALQFYGEAAERNPKNPEPWLGMGRIFAAGGAPLQATQAFGEAFSRDPGNGLAARQYARGLLAQEKAADALAALTQHLKKNGADAELFNLLGIANDLTLDSAAAEKAYREGLAKTQPGGPWFDALNGNLALSLAAAGRVSEAILLLNPNVGDLRARQQNMTPAQSQYRQNLALVYALSGNPESAFEVAKSALGETEAGRNREFYARLPSLTDYDRVRAVFLGKLPAPQAPQ